MVVVDVGLLWVFLSSALVVLMQAQALRLAKTNRELASSEAALRSRNAELDGANKRLGEVDALKNRFLAGMAQDMRRPLHSLLSQAQLVQRHHSENPDIIPRLVRGILDEGNALVRLIDDLPERGHVDWRALDSNESKVDPAKVLREAVSAIESVAACQRVRITCNAPQGLSTVWANHERLVHTLVLLLDNAVTYSPRESDVRAEVVAAGPEIVFRIEQAEGLSLPVSKIQEILESRRPSDGGSDSKGGFTLAHCREIVEAHRGRFWIDSRPELGTVCYVALPAIEYEPRAAAYSSTRGPRGANGIGHADHAAARATA